MGELIIRPLHLGNVVRDKSVFTYLRNIGQRVEAPILAWYIEGGGCRLLVDTGGHDPDAVDMHGPYSRAAGQHPAAALNRLGTRPEDIDFVILTHLHWDHASNIDLFPNARIIVQQEELRYAAAPLAPHRWAYRIHPAMALDDDRYQIVDGDAEICDGVRVWLTPGHSPGFQGVSVRTSRLVYFIAGDNVPLMEMWNGMEYYGAAHWPGTLHVDLNAYTQSLKRIESLGDIILPGHDPCILEQREYR
jgi:glyoxylase-like metal-dependent hydrolase (beta-lactamase superfamily II)